jgi:SAM-dependent methyltransferase
MKEEQNLNEWYSTWFNSKYYHILYKNRSFKEAELFIDNLSDFLKIKSKDKVLDVACGKGRHSIYLSKKGFDVTGVDLSPVSIEYASQFSSPNLHFQIGDMRSLPYKGDFDYVLNMFTSFGYFDNDEENKSAFISMSNCLKEGGKLVIDFMNTEKVMSELIPLEVKTVDGIDFHIEKKIEHGFILKNISFSAEGQKFLFQEKVRALVESDFINYANFAGLKITNIFGDYALNPLNKEKSDRLIFIISN